MYIIKGKVLNIVDLEKKHRVIHKNLILFTIQLVRQITTCPKKKQVPGLLKEQSIFIKT